MMYLGMRGYRVSATGDGDEAKRIVKEDPPALVIMDFQIEEGDAVQPVLDAAFRGLHIGISRQRLARPGGIATQDRDGAGDEDVERAAEGAQRMSRPGGDDSTRTWQCRPCRAARPVCREAAGEGA